MEVKGKMSKKIYVGSLSYQTDEDSLKEAFSALGEVQSVKIIKDEAGRSKGFGFVEMTSSEDAEKAISSLNGSSLMGRTLVVNEARPQTDKGRRDGSGRPNKSFGRDREPRKWR